MVKNLADIYFDEGEFGNAEQNYEDIIINYKPSLTSEALAELYNNLSQTAFFTQNFKKSLDHLTQALALRRKLHGDEHPLVAEIYYNMAMVLKEVRDDEEAKNYFQKALKIRLDSKGYQHFSVAESYIR